MNAVKRVTEISIEVVIGLTVVGLVLAVSILVPKEKQVDAKWVGLFFHTVTVFGFLIYWSKPSLRAWRFWTMFLVLLGAHLTIFALALGAVDHWALLLFVIAAGLEWLLMVPLLASTIKPSKEGQSARNV